MAINRAFYEALTSLQAALGREQLPAFPLPDPDATHRQFALWFAVQSFLIVQMIDDDATSESRLSEGLTESVQRVGAALNRLNRTELPVPRRRSRLATLASWLSMGSSAVGGSNWCRHPGDPDDEDVPMEVYRNLPRTHVKPELEMTCTHLHTTRYDTVAGPLIAKL